MKRLLLCLPGLALKHPNSALWTDKPRSKRSGRAFTHAQTGCL